MRTRLFILTGLIISLLQACGAGEEKPWSTKNEVIVHQIGEPKSLHPTNDNSGPKSDIEQYLQMYLLSTDLETFETIPMLADSLPTVSEDGLNYTFHLRDGIKWDDESPLAPEDVAFTFKVAKCVLVRNPMAKPYIENLADISIDSEGGITFHMKQIYIKNLEIAAMIPVMQRSFYDPDGVFKQYSVAQIDTLTEASASEQLQAWGKWFNAPDNGRNPEFVKGLGPYQFERWESGQEIHLTKKPQHWTSSLPAQERSHFEKAYADRIVFRINADQNSQLLSIRSQDYDVAGQLQIQSLLQLKDEPRFQHNYQLKFLTTFYQNYIGLNTKPDGVLHPKIFDDVLVRKAFSHAVPYHALNLITKNGMSERSVGPVYPMKPHFDTTLVGYAYDIEMANNLLDQAGWVDADGDFIREKTIEGRIQKLEFDLHYMTTQTTWKDMAELVAEAGMDVGMKINLKPLEFSKHYEKAMKHDFDAMLAAWGGGPGLDDHKQLWHTESWKKNGANFTGFGDSHTDGMIDSMRRAVHYDDYLAISRRFQAKVLDDAPYVFLFSGLEGVVVHRRFEDPQLFPFGSKVLSNTLQLQP